MYFYKTYDTQTELVAPAAYIKYYSHIHDGFVCIESDIV